MPHVCAGMQCDCACATLWPDRAQSREPAWGKHPMCSLQPSTSSACQRAVVFFLYMRASATDFHGLQGGRSILNACQGKVLGGGGDFSEAASPRGNREVPGAQASSRNSIARRSASVLPLDLVRWRGRGLRVLGWGLSPSRCGPEHSGLQGRRSAPTAWLHNGACTPLDRRNGHIRMHTSEHGNHGTYDSIDRTCRDEQVSAGPLM